MSSLPTSFSAFDQQLFNQQTQSSSSSSPSKDPSSSNLSGQALPRFVSFAGPVRSSYSIAPVASSQLSSPGTSSSPSAHTPQSNNSSSSGGGGSSNSNSSASTGSGRHSHAHSLSSVSSALSSTLHRRSASGKNSNMSASQSSDSSDPAYKKRKISPEAHSTSPHQRSEILSHKRGESGSKSDHEPSSNSEGSGIVSVNGKPTIAATTKRVKTARACDSCRRKKIRCSVVDDGQILGHPNNGNGGMTCAHCRQYGFECTFFLPITETRFKKKREREAEEMAAAAAAAAAAGRTHLNAGHLANGGPGVLPPLMHHGARHVPMGNMMSPFAPTGAVVPSGSLGPNTSLPLRPSSHSANPLGIPTSANRNAHLDVPPVRISSTQEWPRPHDAGKDRSPPSSRELLNKHSDGHSSVPSSATSWSVKSSSQQMRQSSGSEANPKGSPSIQDDDPPPPNTRVLGPTSIAYIVHSTAFVPGAAIEEHDLKHHQTFEVGASGDGIIKFHPPPVRNAAALASSAEDGEDSTDETAIRLPDSLRGRLAGDVAEKLVNTYFEKLGYLFPIISKSEFLHMSAPPPLMLYAICGIAALSREVPKEVLSSIRVTLSSLFRNNDLFSTSNINNVKALLITSLHSDIHGSTAVQAGSRGWNRIGAAIRMAQDLGMHRDASGRDDLDDDAFFLEQKRRIWGFCVTADRCLSISLGHPLAIDLTDCDVRLPSPHEILRFPSDLPSRPDDDKPFAFNTEMLKLSILFGRVMKTIYSPTGLTKTTDEEIVGLLNDIDRWKEGLPEALQFRGASESPPPAGILHVSYACLVHLFFRVFMRISYNCPQHLTFALTIERMTELIKVSREAVAWVDLNDFYLDTVQFVSYALVFCATVQYHAWIRRGDPEALATLKRAADCVNRFRRPGEVGAHEDLSMRAKTAEVITLLHKCAMGVYNNAPNSGNLNPTAGVTNRRWTDTVGGIVFKPDQTRPGGGVYVATKNNLMLDDLPQGTMILQETEQGAVPALIRTHHESSSSGAWRAVGEMVGQSHDGKQLANATANLTHLAGDVWADADGRPVDRQGARLLTMIPVPGGDALIQSYPGGPRLSFSSIAGGIAPPSNVNGTSQQPHANGGSNGDASNMSDTAWLNAMAAQVASQQALAIRSGEQRPTRGTMDNGGTNIQEGSTAPTFNFSDLYTFDGQIAQPAAMMQSASSRSAVQGAAAAAAAPPPGGFSAPSSSSATFALAADPSSFNSMGADPLSLDGMPEQLDFAAWDQWFRSAATTTVNTAGS